tara:strand:+ start:1853 stop:2809 length:957 start_codon:yes stop_codon:yes gene_type:complete
MRVAVWGLGKHAINNILPALEKVSGLSLFGVYTRDEKIKNQCVKRFNCKTWKSQNEMLEDDDVDIIYLSTPPALHYKSGIEILSSGKHFWCEKPFTTSLKHTEKLIEISRKNNLSIAEGLMYIHHPQYQMLKKEVEKYKPYEIKRINSTFTLPHSKAPSFRHNPDLGGSTLLDIGIYPLSIVIKLLEQDSYNILLKKSYIDEYSKVDMNGFVIIEFSSGTICNLFWGMGFGYKNEIDILTTKGSYYCDKIFSKKEYYIPNIMVKDNFGESSNIKTTAHNHFISMFKHFKKLAIEIDKAEIEREEILKLAKVIDLIKSN